MTWAEVNESTPQQKTKLSGKGAEQQNIPKQRSVTTNDPRLVYKNRVGENHMQGHKTHKYNHDRRYIATWKGEEW